MVIRFTRSNFLRLLVISCLFMTSCGNEVPFPRCVSADNFNSSTTISVSAYYGANNVDAFRAESGEIGDGSIVGAQKQIVRWQDTGLVTDGDEIVVKVQGAWIPWEKNGEKHSPIMAVNSGISRPTDLSDEFYDSVVDVDRVCGPYKQYDKQVGGCKMQCHAIPAQDEDGTGQYGRPCWLEKGYGAYLLFRKPGDQDPNASLDLMEFPESPTTHLGYESAHDGGEATYRSSGRIYDVNCKAIDPQKGWKVYVKILDNYYHDNAGGYSLEFTKGVAKGTSTDIFESVRTLVRDELDRAGKKIFQNISSDNEFRNFVFALITLSIVFTALTYIFGLVRAPLADLIAKLLKIVLVLLLISPGSWDFFYNHLLRLFLQGVDEIIAILNEYALGQKVFDKTKPFSFMDIMIRDRIFSAVVWEAKARALIAADWSSIFALLIIIIAVLFYVGLCLYGFVIYLTAFVGITFLISLMPILFVGILFSRFKSLFDGWLTQCISFSMQAILMFTLIAMFGTLIMHYYYRIFGFTACYNEWIRINIPLIINRGYYEWTPGQKYDTIIIGKGGTEKRAYPEAGASARYTFTGGGAVIRVPPDYKDEDFRYVDYPFLDPDIKSKTVPGGVVLRDDTDQGRKFKNLAALVNMLVASERSSSIARIVNKIEKELQQLKSDGAVTSSSLSKFEDKVSKKRKEGEKANWTDPVFKNQLLSLLIGEVIANNASQGTPLKELEDQYDYNIIKNIKQGWIVMWSEVFGLILIAFLVWQMRAFVQSIAVVLSGGGMMSRTVASMYSEGFARIFSGIPIFGRVIDTVDRSIDVARLFARAKIAGIGSAVAEAPEKLIARVPIVGGTIGGMVKGMRHVSGALMSSHTEADLYSMKSISPRFDYARAWLGAHLGYSPLDALKYAGKFSLAKMMGNTSGGLLDNVRQDHAKVMQNLRTLTIGVDKYKPGVYVPKRDEEDDKNPFRRPDAAEKRKDEEDRAKLFDDNGNLHIHRGNFWDAVDAMHGLEVMRGQTNDDEARERIQRDIDRIKGEILRLSRASSSEIPELQDFVTSGGGVDFDKLRESALKRRGVDERDEVSGASAAYQGVVPQAEEGSVADLILGTSESEPRAGGQQTLTEEGMQRVEGVDRSLPEGIEVSGHEVADSASASPENQAVGVDPVAEIVPQAEESSVADLISGTSESGPSEVGSQTLTEEGIQGGVDRALPEGMEVGGHEVADSASASPENQAVGVDPVAEIVPQAEESSVADLISGVSESGPSEVGSQTLTEEGIQGGEGVDRALPEGMEVGVHEVADSASASPEDLAVGVEPVAEIVPQAEEGSVADLISGVNESGPSEVGSSQTLTAESIQGGEGVDRSLPEGIEVGVHEVADSASASPEDLAVGVEPVAEIVPQAEEGSVADLISGVSESGPSEGGSQTLTEEGIQGGEGVDRALPEGMEVGVHEVADSASASPEDLAVGVEPVAEIVPQAEEGSVADLISGVNESGPSEVGSSQTLTAESIQGGEGVDRSLPEGIEVGVHEVADSASASPEDLAVGVEPVAEIVPQAEEGSVADLISGVSESGPSEGGSQTLTEEGIQGGEGVDRSLPEGIEVGGHEVADSASASPENQAVGVDPVAEIVPQAEEGSVADLISGDSESGPSEVGSSQTLTEEGIQGGEGVDRALPEGMEVGGHEVADSASASPEDQAVGVEPVAEIVPQAEEGSVADLMSGDSDSSSDSSGDINQTLGKESSVTNVEDMEISEGSGSVFSDSEVEQGRDRFVEVPQSGNAAGVSVEDDNRIEDLLSDIDIADGSSEINLMREESSEPSVHEGEGSNYPQAKGLSKEKHKGSDTRVSSGKRDDKDEAHSGSETDDDSSGLRASGGSKEGESLGESGKVPSSGDDGASAFTSAGEEALEAAALVPEDEALKTVDIPIDQEGDNRNRDEVEAGKKKRETEEIGLVDPNIDLKAELESDKSEAEPAISGIQQDPVADSGIIEKSRVEDKDYTGEGKPLAEAASSDVATEDKVVPAGEEGVESARVEEGLEPTASVELEPTASVELEPAASVALETAESRIEQVRASGDADVKDLPREEGKVSGVTDPDAKREDQRDSVSGATEPESKGDYQERDSGDDGDTAKELPREVVSEIAEPSGRADDPEGDKSDSRSETLDPDVRDGASAFTSAGEEALEAAAFVPEDEALKTVDIPIDRDRDNRNRDEVEAGKKKQEIEEIGLVDPNIDLKAELESDKSKAEPVISGIQQDPVADSGIIEESRVEGKDYTGEGETPAEAASSDVATEDKVVPAGNEALEGELGAEVKAVREGLEPAASVELETAESRIEQEKGSGDADEKDLPREEGTISEVTDPDAKREDQRDSVSGAAEPESKGDYQEKDGDTATELPREVVSETTEPSSLPDDPEGDKSDLRLEKSGSDLGDRGVEGDSKHEVGDESSSRGVSTEDVPGIDSGVEASRVEGKDYTGEGKPLAEVASADVAIEDKVVSAGDKALEGELGVEVTAVREALEPAASVEVETAESRIEQEKDSSDGDVKDLPREDGTVSEATEPESRRDYQEKDIGDDCDVAREREVVPEITEPSSLPNDPEGDKSDSRPERLDPDIRDGSAIEDEVRASMDSDLTYGMPSEDAAVIDKHYSGDDESLAGMVSTEDVPGIDSGVEESRVESKDYTVEGEPLVEAASSDVATEDKVVPAGGVGLDGTLGAEGTATGDVLEATALTSEDAALETVDIPVDQAKGRGDTDVKDIPREDGKVSEVTEPDAKRDYKRDSVSEDTKPESRRDYQEKDGDTAREREVVSEIAESSSLSDDPEGDKSDSRLERLDPDIGDGGAIEDEVEVRSSRGSESTYSVPSDDTVGVDKHYSADDEYKAGMVSTDDVPGIDSGVEGKDYTGEGKPLAEAASSDMGTEDKVVSAGDEALEGELVAEGVAVREALEPAASVESETGESRVEQERASGDADVKDLSREEGTISEVTDPDAKRDYQRDSVSGAAEPESRRDYQEKDGDTATELPREVVLEITEPSGRADDPDGDKSDLRETLDPDIRDGSAVEDIKDEVGSSGDSKSTYAVPSEDAAVIDKHYSGDDESPAGMVSTDDVPGIDSGVEASRVEGKDYIGEGEAPAEAASSDVATEDKVVSAGDEALEGELGAEGVAVREALEPAASVESETGESRVEQEKDSGDAAVKDLSREEGTISEVTDPDAKRYYQKDSVSEATEPESRRDYQERDSGDDGDAAREREVVSEATEYGTRPDNLDGDKSDLRETLDPDIRDGVSAFTSVSVGEGALEAAATVPEDEVRASRSSDTTYSVSFEDSAVIDKHDSGDDESPVGMVSTGDVPGVDSGVEESRVEGKDYTGEGEAPAEAASSDVATEDKVVSAGDKALEGELGAEGVAVREALEPAASVELETAESRVERERDIGDAAVKDLPREEGTVSEATEPESRRDYQEKDGDTAKELPREVVSEIAEPSSLSDDPDGDKSDSRSETLDPDIRDGSAVEDIKDEVGSSRDSESTYGEPSDDSEVVDKHDSGDDESPAGMVSTDDVPGIDSGVEGKDYTGEGEPLAEVASSDMGTEDKVVFAGDEALGGELGAEVTAAREALEPAASVELETAASRIEQERASGDGDVKDLPREEGTISEVTDPDAKRDDHRDSVSGAAEPESKRDYQEKDGDTEKGLPREVVPEITEPSSLPDDPDGDKNDLSSEKPGSDLGDHGVEGDLKHEVGDESPSRGVSTGDVPGIESGVEESRAEGKDYTVEGEAPAEAASSYGEPSDDSEVVEKHDSGDDESPAGMVSTDDVPGIDSGVEASRVEDKDYTGEGEPLAEAASSDVGTEDKVVSAGGVGLDGTLGAEVKAVREALEPAASVELETGESRVERERDSSDADLKDLSREEGKVSEVTDPDAKRDYQRDSASEDTKPESRRDDQEKDGDTATELPREVVSETTEPSSLPDDPEGDKSDSRSETLDPDIRDGSAVEDIKDEVGSSRDSESTYGEPSDDSEVVEKHDSSDDESPVGMVSTEDVPGIDSGVEESRVESKDYTVEGEPLVEAASSDVATEDKVVPAGGVGLDGTLGAEGTATGDVLEATALTSEDAALETVDIPVDQAKGSGDAAVKDLPREDGTVSEATEPESRRDYQEKDIGDDCDVAREREVVPEITEPSSLPNDPEGDKSDSRPERLDPDIGDGGAIEDEVEVRSSRGSESTYSVPSDDTVGVDKHYSADDEYKAGMVSTDDVPVIDSGVEASRVEGKDYTGEGEAPVEAASSDVAIEDKVVSTEDVPGIDSGVEASRVEGKDYTGEGKAPAEAASSDVATEDKVVSAGDKALEGELGAEGTAVREALETAESRIEQEKDSSDADLKDLSREEGTISEVTEPDAKREDQRDSVSEATEPESRRDYQEKDGDTEKELPREVVSEITEPGSRPDDPEGDKSDSRLERLDPDIRDGRAIEDIKDEVRSSSDSDSTYAVPSEDAAVIDKHDSGDDESPLGMVSTDDVPGIDSGVEETRVEGKDYTGEGEAPAEAASSDVVNEDKVVSAGDEALEGELGAEGVAVREALEPAASVESETGESRVERERDIGDADLKDLSREEGTVSEVTEPESKGDYQERDTDVAATELPREVVSETTEPGSLPNDQDGDKSDSRSETLDPNIGDGSAIEDEVRSSGDSKSTYAVPSEDAAVIDKHYSGDDESPAGMVSTDDAPGIDSGVEASRVEGKDYTGEGETSAEVPSSDVATEDKVVSTEDVPGIDSGVEASRVEGKDYTGEGETSAEVPSSDVAPEVVSAGDEALEGELGAEVKAAREALEPAASVELETAESRIEQVRARGDGYVKDLSREEGTISEVTDPKRDYQRDSVSEDTKPESRRDYQEKDGDTATELPREVVPEATEYGTRPDDPEGDKSDLRSETLDPNIGDGSAIEDEVRASRDSDTTDGVQSKESAVIDKHYSGDDESPAGMVSTDDVPGIDSGVEASRVEDKDYTGEGEPLAEAASSDVGTEDKVVSAGGEALEGELGAEGVAVREALEPAASVELETGESRVEQEKDSSDADVKDLPREDGKVSEAGTRPDNLDGDQRDLRSEKSGSDLGDHGVEGDSKHEVGDESSSREVSTEDVPGIDSGVEESRVEGKDDTGEGEAPAEAASSDVATEVVSAGGEALEGELGAEVKAAREALEPVASVELETAESRVEQERDSSDADVKDLPREVVSETTEPSSRPDDPEGDKRDLRSEKSGSDLGDHGVEGDSKHEVGDESPSRGVSTEDAPGIDSGVEETRVEGKDYTVEGEPLVEAASSDVATEDKVVPAGGVGLDGTLGAEGTATGDVLEATALTSEDAALETVDIPVDQAKGSGDAAVKDLSREEGTISEVTDPKRDYQRDSVSGDTEPESRRDYQEKDGDTAREREVVSEIAESSSLSDDPEGDKSDSRLERLDPDIGDGGAIEDEVEVRSSRGSESTYSVPSDDTVGVDKHYSADDDEYKAGMVSTDDVPVIDSGVEASRVEGKDYTGEGEAPVEAASSDVAIEDKVVSTEDVPVIDSGVEASRVEGKDYTGEGEAPVEAASSDVAIEDKVVSTEDVPVIDSGVEASRVEGKDYTGEGKAPAEAASSDVATEDKVVSAGDEALEGELGAEGTAAREALEPAASASEDAALETVDIPVDQAKDSSDADLKDLSREEGTISEVTDPDAKRGDQRDSVSEATEPESRRDYQEKDGDTEKELPREVVPEITEPSSLPDDLDGDKSDLRLETLDPDIMDGSAVEDEVRASRGSDTTYGVSFEDSAVIDKHDSGDDESTVGMVSTDDASGIDSGVEETRVEGKDYTVEGEPLAEAASSDVAIEDKVVSTEDVPGIDSGVEASRVEGKDYTGEGKAPAEAASSDVATEDKVVSAGDKALEGELGAEGTAVREALETAESRVEQERDSSDADVKDLPREVVSEITEPGSLPNDPEGDKSDLRSEMLDPDIGDGRAIEDIKDEVRSSSDSDSTYAVPSEDAAVIDKHDSGDDESPLGMVSTEDVPNVEASGVEDKHYTAEGKPPAEVASTDVGTEDKVVSAGDEALEGELGAEGTAAREALEPAASASEDAALETVDIPVDQAKDSSDADLKDLSREEGTISEVTDPDAKRGDQRDSVSGAAEPESKGDYQKDIGDDGDAAREREVVPEITEPSSLPDDLDGDKSDLRLETLDPDIMDGSAVEDEVEVRSSKKTLLMRKEQVEASVLSAATKDMASEALKSGKEEDVVRDASSKVAAPIEDRGLLKTENNVTAAAQKQSDTDTLEPFSGTSSNKKKAKKGDAGKSKKQKPKRKEGQPSGVSTHEILKGILSTMTSENISHQDKSLPEKEQEQDASKETHQDEKKKSQEKEREEKAQKQKSSISKMQRKISKLKSRIAQGNLTEDEIQALKNKIAEIEADINGLDS
ncbi:type IV secretion system protein [Anaplasma phagocytophilum]|uniref:type IV secretion system protein n=1 Tax=Anaplasma phagocytophilum TaxID=948 RepID=UPI0015DE80CF|nr:type IV secretion system protein [Anaplasma phagocytophilum]